MTRMLPDPREFEAAIAGFPGAEQLPGYGPATPVPIFQWEKEFEVLLELYCRAHPVRVLEIGTYHGGTLFHWLRNAEPGATIVSVDSYAVGVDNRHLYSEWVPDPEEVDLYVIQGDSRDPDTFEQVQALSDWYDWIFIDAGHFYPEVLSDWNTYGPLASSPGIVCFHDILPPTRAHPEIEVAQLWEELKQTHRTLEIVADRDAEWGGIGVVLT